MSPDPLPSSFLDWSSLGSPHTRTSPHSAPDIRVEQNENIQNQLSVPSAVVTRQEMVRTGSPEEVNISPQTDQQIEDQSVPAIGVEPAPLNIEVGMQRDDIESNEENNIPTTQASRSVMPYLNVGELIPSPNIQQESGNNSDTSRGSHVRTQDRNVQEHLSILPVERLISSRGRRIVPDNINMAQHHPQEGIHPQRTSTSNRRDYPDDSSNDNRSLRGHRYSNERGRPPEEGRYPNRDRRPPRRGGLHNNGRPPDRYGGGPPDGGGPLMMEDYLMETEDPHNALIEEDPQDLEALLDQ